MNSNETAMTKVCLTSGIHAGQGLQAGNKLCKQAHAWRSRRHGHTCRKHPLVHVLNQRMNSSAARAVYLQICMEEGANLPRLQAIFVNLPCKRTPEDAWC